MVMIPTTIVINPVHTIIVPFKGVDAIEGYTRLKDVDQGKSLM